MRDDLRLSERISGCSARSHRLSQKTGVPWIEYVAPISHTEKWRFISEGKIFLYGYFVRTKKYLNMQISSAY